MSKIPKLTNPNNSAHQASQMIIWLFDLQHEIYDLQFRLELLFVICLCFLQEVNTGEFRNLEVFCKCNIGCPTFVDVIKIPQFWILTKWQNKAKMMMMNSLCCISVIFLIVDLL